MKTTLFAALAVTLCLIALATARTSRERITAAASTPETAQSNQPPKMTITRSGGRGASKGPEANFTGQVSVEMLFPPIPPARAAGASVTFEPGARSAWHTHPLGQTMIVTSGTGWVQQEGGQKQEIKPGDVVWTPPGVKHWHGATATDRMTHIAIQEALDGKMVEWMEKVSDEQYRSSR
jgi:quercetin dioxygenase-like cupin family protein